MKEVDKIEEEEEEEEKCNQIEKSSKNLMKRIFKNSEEN